MLRSGMGVAFSVYGGVMGKRNKDTVNEKRKAYEKSIGKWMKKKWKEMDKAIYDQIVKDFGSGG